MRDIRGNFPRPGIIRVAPSASRRYRPGDKICRSPEARMSVDIQTVKRVARLARIAVSEEDAERMTGELNAILGFVEQLNEVDVSGVEPMTSVIPMEMKKRQDVVTDGSKPDDIVANAPAVDANFFLVPKVVE
jgi:aspartyl-tRNA(Asn)/glutamyl-tRNA(Gln) amidotransferase subunit C